VYENVIKNPQLTSKYVSPAHQTGSGMKIDIFWGEVYLDEDGDWCWCRSNERVHLNVVPTKDGKPHIGAMTRAGDRDNLYLLSLHDTDVKNKKLFCFKYPPE